MQRVSSHIAAKALEAVGIQAGDHVFVHSNLIRFGMPEKGVSTYLDAFDAILGSKGTLAVPTFSFSFIGSGTYHWEQTASEGMGVFAEAVRRKPQAHRTRHPMQSVAAAGVHSTEMARIETPSAYEPDGVFQWMCDVDFKVLLLGADPIHISHSHLSEETCRVPYRFDKVVRGQTLLAPGEDWTEGDWLFFARNLELDVRPEGEDIIVEELVDAGVWQRSTLNDVPVLAGSARAFVDALNEKLRADVLWMDPNRTERSDG